MGAMKSLRGGGRSSVSPHRARVKKRGGVRSSQNNEKPSTKKPRYQPTNRKQLNGKCLNPDTQATDLMGGDRGESLGIAGQDDGGKCTTLKPEDRS